MCESGWAALVTLTHSTLLGPSLHVLCPTPAVPCGLLLRSHSLLATMGALIVGTVLFALMTVLAYFCVSVVWRNDKDSQACVAAARFGEEHLSYASCAAFFSPCFVLLVYISLPFVCVASRRHVYGLQMSTVWQRHDWCECG